MIHENYPRIFDRIKALFTDYVVILASMVAVSFIFEQFEEVSEETRIFVFVFILFLYDPIFTSIFGGTIGHMFIGLRVRRDPDEEKNIVFPIAVIRFLLKTLLGWISLLTIMSNEKGKAIHDSVVGSVVVYANSKKVLQANPDANLSDVGMDHKR